jgi:hypothetical protein
MTASANTMTINELPAAANGPTLLTDAEAAMVAAAGGARGGVSARGGASSDIVFPTDYSK